MLEEMKSSDPSGRLTFEVSTPIERAAGRCMGCFSVAMVVVGTSAILTPFKSGGASIGKTFIAAAAWFGAIYLLYRLYISINCYYVVDQAGKQLLYHFGAVLIEYEDPIAAFDDIVGVGLVVHPIERGQAVVIGLRNGRLQRISDFCHTSMLEPAKRFANLLSVPFFPGKADSAPHIRDGKMILGAMNAKEWQQSFEDAQSWVLTVLLFPMGCMTFAFLLMAIMIGLGLGEDTRRKTPSKSPFAGYRYLPGTAPVAPKVAPIAPRGSQGGSRRGNRRGKRR